MAALPKETVIYLSRAIGVNMPGRADPEMLTKGRNLVDAEVAAHPFVVAHFLAGAQAEALAGADEALIAANAELTAQVEALTARAEAAEATVAEQKDMLDAYAATSKPAK